MDLGEMSSQRNSQTNKNWKYSQQQNADYNKTVISNYKNVDASFTGLLLHVS